MLTTWILIKLIFLVNRNRSGAVKKTSGFFKGKGTLTCLKNILFSLASTPYWLIGTVKIEKLTQ